MVKSFDLQTNSLDQFLKEMYGDQSGEFVCGYRGLKGGTDMYLVYGVRQNTFTASRGLSRRRIDKIVNQQVMTSLSHVSKTQDRFAILRRRYSLPAFYYDFSTLFRDHCILGHLYSRSNLKNKLSIITKIIFTSFLRNRWTGNGLGRFCTQP